MKQTFKNGDFVACDCNSAGNKWLFIWEKEDLIFIRCHVGYIPSKKKICKGCICYLKDTFRPMTKIEKQMFLNTLNAEGMAWDAANTKVVQLSSFTPEKGDFVVCDKNKYGNKWLFIYKGVSKLSVICHIGFRPGSPCTAGPICGLTDTLRPMTEKEKKAFLNKINEEEKDWDPINKQVVDAFFPKDGDFVAGDYGGSILISIFKKATNSEFGKVYANMYSDGTHLEMMSDINSTWIQRKATDAEKELLLNAMREKGKDWDAKNKQVIDYKWKPELGGDYCIADPTIEEMFNTFTFGSDDVDKMWSSRSLIFKTKEEAIVCAKKMLKAI